MKVCKCCGKEKTIEEFFNEKSYKCLQCRKERKKEKRDERYANPDLKKIYKSRRKERYANPEIKERIIKSRKKYNSKPETKKLIKERYTKDEYSKISSILKNDAKEFIRKLIYEKKIKKQSECECFLCNKSSKESRIYYHHPDYNEFSKVIPLCAVCHSEVHSFMKIIYPKEIFEGIEIPEKYKNKIIFL